MNIYKSIFARLGIIIGAATTLPIIGIILVALIALAIPACVLGVIWAVCTMSDDSLMDCFRAKEVDPDLIID